MIEEDVSARNLLRRAMARRELEHESNLRELKDEWKSEALPTLTRYAEDDQHAECRDAFLRLYEQGYSDPEMARRLVMGVASVQRRRVALGLKPNRVAKSDERAETIRQLVSEGLSDVEIAAKVGTCRQNVGHIRRRYGLARGAK